MFDSLKNALGLNTLKVQTTLNNTTIEVGSTLTGVVTIHGADRPKTINCIDLYLFALVEKDLSDDESSQAFKITSLRLSTKTTIEKEQTLSLPFELLIPYETPITNTAQSHHAKIHLWLETDVDVEATLDSSDKDPVFTTPTSTMANFLEAMDSLGFHLILSDVKTGHFSTSFGNSSLGHYQEFECRNQDLGAGMAKISFLPKDGFTHVILKIDHVLDSDSYNVISLTDTMTIAKMAELIRQKLSV